VAFTISAPDRSAQRKHIALRPTDWLDLLFGGAAQRAAARRRDMDAVRQAASALAQLPESYVVFNDFRPTTGPGLPARWSVDHVVIGPSGVFAIHTAHAPDSSIAPAATSRRTAADVRSVQQQATQFRAALGEWSCGSFGEVFVKPVLVYAQDDAFVEKLQEGPVKVIPLKWLATEVTERTFEQLSPDQVYRIAYALFEQLPLTLQHSAQEQLDRLGVLARAWLAQQVAPQLVLPIALD
jgi:hypothetical protein